MRHAAENAAVRKLALLAAPLLGLLLAGSVEAGMYVPPPGDCCPQWSPQGTQIVFAGNRGQGTQVGAVAVGGGPERFVPGIPVGVRSPDWTRVAFVKDGKLRVARVDGSDEHVLGETNGDVTWAPDSQQLAFAAFDGRVRVAGVDGTGARVLAHPGTQPAWSPRGNLIAYSSGRNVHVVWADGSGNAVVAPGPRTDVEPVWSPDGTQLAYWSSDGRTALLRVAEIGGNGGLVTLKIAGAVTNGSIVWAPDGRTIFGAGSAGLVGIDLDTGARHTLTGISNAVFSPDGRRIAYAAGGECRDRVGIYWANAEATARTRVTNSCRIYGTSGPDVIHADFSRVVYGAAGDDVLYADDTYYFFDGNTLIGGPGNDLLIGGYAQDTLLGGPGNDTIEGGPSIDVIKGGPGRDRIDGEGGGDIIDVRDGERDVVRCGKNSYDSVDAVDADRLDVIASDCEFVRRR